MVRKLSLKVFGMLALIISLTTFTAVTVYAATYNPPAFDLETGTVCTYNPDSSGFCPGADFSISLSPGLVLIDSAQGASVDASYQEVDFETASSQELTQGWSVTLFNDNDPTIVIRTKEGNLFKVGNFRAGSMMGNVAFDYELLQEPVQPVEIPFGEASYIKVPAGQKTLCIDRETEEVFDCTDPDNPITLSKHPITDLAIKIEVNGEYLPVQEIKDNTLIEAGENSCYPWCFGGHYYLLCY